MIYEPHNKINHSAYWIGRTFNFYTVHEIVKNPEAKAFHWVVKCVCGTVKGPYAPNVIKRGFVKSCGCKKRKPLTRGNNYEAPAISPTTNS